MEVMKKVRRNLFGKDPDREDEPFILKPTIPYKENEEWTQEELEDIDRQVQKWLQYEELLIEKCYEEMLREEEEQWHYFDNPQQYNSTVIQVFYSDLDPQAPEFIPGIQWRGKYVKYSVMS